MKSQEQNQRTARRWIILRTLRTFRTSRQHLKWSTYMLTWSARLPDTSGAPGKGARLGLKGLAAPRTRGARSLTRSSRMCWFHGVQNP